MNTIDRTLKYVDLYLINDNLDNIKEYPLPEGYRFVTFKEGDEKDWIEIEMSSGELLTYEEGVKTFQRCFANYYEKLKTRCIFIENAKGEKVATSTAFYLDPPTEGITGNVQWISIKREYQGHHLSKPLICETLKQTRKLGHKKTILHTQTHTWLAVKVYLDMGFVPYKPEERYLGWQIIKKLTNHEKLKNVGDISTEEMYNPIYVQAYEFLRNHFNEPFVYKVWDKKGPYIGINANGQIHYYKYSFEDGKLKIEGENNEYRKVL